VLAQFGGIFLVLHFALDELLVLARPIDLAGLFVFELYQGFLGHGIEMMSHYYSGYGLKRQEMGGEADCQDAKEKDRRSSKRLRSVK
jgi:hypothetical protein